MQIIEITWEQLRWAIMGAQQKSKYSEPFFREVARQLGLKAPKDESSKLERA